MSAKKRAASAAQLIAVGEERLLLGRTSDTTLGFVETCLSVAATADASDPAHTVAVARFLGKITNAYDKLSDGGRKPLTPEEERIVKAVRAAISELERIAPPPRPKP